MALSRRELNAAKRGKRAMRGQYGPDIRLVRSNSAVAQPGQVRGDAAERGSVVLGVCQDTGMRRFEQPKRNTMSRHMMTSWNAGASAGYDRRPGEYWTPQHAARQEAQVQTRKRTAVVIVDDSRELTPMPLGMSGWDK